jgi:outer membrane protein assembly factor BamB
MSRQIIWQYGTTGVSGSGDNQLSHPSSASPSANGNILITGRHNHRVIEVDKDRQIIWQYGTSGATGSGDNQLNYPWSASPLANGNILITGRHNHRVIEVDR